MKRSKHVSLTVALCLCIAGRALAQGTQSQSPSSQQQQGPPALEEFQKRLDALEKWHKSEIGELRSEIEGLEDEVARAKAKAAVPSTQSASAFNPGITVFGNFLSRFDSQPVFLDDDPANGRVDDRMQLREVELDMRAAIDPWADGVLIATFESGQPGQFITGVEEGYVLLKKLPGLDSAPGGLKLKVGRFRPSFGRFNTIHLHDLPWSSYPRALQNFLGPEGFIGDGISGQFFLPSPSDQDTLDATVQVLDGGNIAVDSTARPSDIALLGHVKWFRDLAPGKDLEIGLSSWFSNEDHQLYGLDATYHWKPAVAGEWKSFLIGTEVYQAALDDPAVANHPSGFDVWTQYQLGQNLYLGLRYDWAEDLKDQQKKTQTIGSFLTYYTTEFLRFRLGLEHTTSDIDTLDGLNSVFLELNFIYGSHPSEPYWVNR